MIWYRETNVSKTSHDSRSRMPDQPPGELTFGNRSTSEYTRFEIAWVSDDKLGTVIARRIGDDPFDVFDNSQLGGCPLVPQVDTPRAHDRGKRTDLFAFHLCDKSDVDKFMVGQTAELTRASAGENEGGTEL